MRSMKKRASLLGVVFILAAITVFSVAGSVTEGQPVRLRLILVVEMDFGSFHGPELGEQGAFNVLGDTGSGAGTFQCWGWMFEDGLTTNISQVYNIAGRGRIMTQGREIDDAEPLAVVGGTGDFKNVRGEASVVWGEDGFTITFDIRGAHH